MKPASASVFSKIMPFLGIGIFLVILVMAFILLSYILLIGAIIGLILFVISYFKQIFFSNKSKKSVVASKKLPRTFDNDEFK